LTVPALLAETELVSRGGNMPSNLSRRRFLAASAAMVGAAELAPGVAAETPPRRIHVGIQLWTLRKETAADPAGTLRRVAEIGYQGVELWFQNWPKAPDLKKMLDDSGLKIASAHVALKELLDDFPRVADYHRTIGNQTLVIPYIPNFAGFTDDDWRRTIDDLRHAARTGTEAGFQVLYHNHDFEFTTKVDGVEVFDRIFGSIEPQLLGAEIDVFFVADIGRDPAELLRKFAGRLKRVHLKEKSKPGSKSKTTELGRGTIDWPAVLEAAARSGTEWYLVEQDCEDRPALESVRISFEYLKSRGVV
jgi:sugar phosphate isomerase/epimerase